MAVTLSMENVSVRNSKMPMDLAKIVELLENGGGQIVMSTTPFRSILQDMEEQYWKYHSPLGNPGDVVLLLEDYRVDHICQSADGYSVTFKYKDDTTNTIAVSRPMALTPKDQWISAEGAVTDLSIRCRCVIQDIQLIGDDWVFVLTIPSTTYLVVNP